MWEQYIDGWKRISQLKPPKQEFVYIQKKL